MTGAWTAPAGSSTRGAIVEVERTMDGRQHLLALDSLRGICACLVALYHFGSDAWIADNRLIGNAFLFVDLFFVLSGFVIANSYSDKLRAGMSPLRFMGLRAGRLYPLHLAVLLGLLGLQAISLFTAALPTGGGDHSAWGFVVTLLLLQVFTRAGAGAWNPPSWSISAEFWTYLVFALLCRWGRRLFWPILIVGVALMPLAMLQATDRHINACFSGALARCLYSFGIGVVCRSAWQRFSPRLLALGGPWLTACELAAMTIALLLVMVVGAGAWSFACPWVFALLVLLLAVEGGAVSRILKLRPFVFLGTLSYSIYMVHEPVQARIMNLLSLFHYGLAGSGEVRLHMVSRAGPLPFGSDLLTIMMLIITIAAAWVTFRLIEEPGRIASRRWLSARPADTVKTA